MGEAAKTESAPTTATRQEWFTTPEAADYCRISRDALLKQIAKGYIKPDSRSRPGLRTHRFKRATLDAWLMGGDGGDQK